jgi:pantoate--beta-alanine ligase
MPTAITESASAPRRPLIIDTPAALRLQCARVRRSGLSLGMVPTMGALHAGHRSLIERARADCDRVVVSIFVNPTQFGPGEDLSRYPRPFEDDVDACAEAGVDIVFAPSPGDMYPEGFDTGVHVGGALGTTLEAMHRPGHFVGVATVVAKLLTAALPDRAYFGHKDAQQCAVVRRVVADLDVGTEIVVCPTVRDADGLALSSRNAYLGPEERRTALAIPRALAAAAAAWKAGERSASALRTIASEILAASPGLRPDYVAVVDPETFSDPLDGCVRCEILIAARIGGTRLIDVLSPGLDDPPVVDGEGCPSAGTDTESNA